MFQASPLLVSHLFSQGFLHRGFPQPLLETPQEIHIFGRHTMGVPIRGMGLIKAVPFKVQVSLEDWKILEGKNG